MKILVAHPGKQHVFRLASALNDADMLAGLVTTVYNKPGTITHLLLSLLPQKLKVKAVRRKSDELPEEKIIVKCELLGLICTAISKIPFLKKFYFVANDLMNDCFGKVVAKYAIQNNIDAVISFDNNSMKVFEYLKKHAPQIKRILDVSIASRIYLKEVYQKDLNMHYEEGLFNEQAVLWKEKYMQRIRRELEAAQFFLAGSEFVKNSLIFSGISEKRIRVIHYGVDTSAFKRKNITEEQTGLNLIYVGGLAYRKGLHHLLKVVSELLDSGISLSLAGDFSRRSELYKCYCNFPNIHFLGFLTHEKLALEYQKADAFILASLGEGMAMVGLEAMSSGLPVICSTNTGLTDVINQGINGYVFDTADDQQLCRLLRYLLSHKAELKRMGKQARNTAVNYTWDNYGNNIIKTIKEFGEIQ